MLWVKDSREYGQKLKEENHLDIEPDYIWNILFLKSCQIVWMSSVHTIQYVAQILNLKH